MYTWVSKFKKPDQPESIDFKAMQAKVAKLKGVGIAAQFGAFAGKFTSLCVLMATTPCIATQLATDFGLVASKQSGNLRDVVLGFHKSVNLISFNLAKLGW